MRRFALILFFIALAIRLAIAWKSAMFSIEGSSEVESIAVNLATTGEYGNPYATFTGPTAHSPPVYPLFLAALYSILGTGAAARMATVAITSALAALRCALLPLFALDAGLDRRIAVLSGVLSTIYVGGSLQSEVRGHSDVAWLGLVLLVLVWTSLRMWRTRSWKAQTPWWFFAFCGFAALLDPVVLPVLAGFVLAGLTACPRLDRRGYLRQVLLLACAIFVCLLPWAIRNYVALGSPILTRSNFGLELWLSNGPGRSYDLMPNVEARHPSWHSAESAQVADLGEVRYNRLKFDEARDWMLAHPAEFFRLTGQRFLAWWFPPSPIPLLFVLRIALTLLAGAGIVLLRRTLVGRLFALTWLMFPAVYYVIQWTARYRFPMDWQLVLCASVALWGICARFWNMATGVLGSLRGNYGR